MKKIKTAKPKYNRAEDTLLIQVDFADGSESEAIKISNVSKLLSGEVELNVCTVDGDVSGKSFRIGN